MSRATPDGGMAFPGFEHTEGHGRSRPGPTGAWENYQHGMTLRDYFAAHVPASVLDIEGWTTAECAKVLGIETYSFRPNYAQLMSKLAYEYADAMLKARDA